MFGSAEKKIDVEQERLNFINNFAVNKGLVFRILNGQNIKYLSKEIETSGKHSSQVIFQSDQLEKFTVNGIDYYGLTIPNTFIANRHSSLKFENIIFASCFEDLKKLTEYLKKKYYVEPDNSCQLMVWNNRHGQYVSSGEKIGFKSADSLVGVEDFFNIMEKDIKALGEKEELVKKLGADSGFNYFVYGPPGTGKTSSVKALIHKLKVPGYCVNLSHVSANRISKALTPKDNNKIKIVLVEDFDRYINSNEENSYMSDLLNALDGVGSCYGTIRIFSANMPENTLTDAALRSRISRFIKFDLPEKNHIRDHILHVFPDKIEEANILADLCKKENLSIRVINSFMSKFIMEDEPLKHTIENFATWLKEMEEIKEIEDKHKKDKKETPQEDDW